MRGKHILLTTDLSDESQRAFSPVADLAEMIGAGVTLLHVVQVLTPVSQGALMGATTTPPPSTDDRKSAMEALEGLARSLPGNLDVKLEVQTAPNVAQSIVEYAEQNDVGLIAMSTHGRTGFRRLVLGSIAEGVLRHSSVPVLCFPPTHG